MTWPAYEAIGRDVQLGYARWRVWMYLVNTPILFHDRPVDVKVNALAASIPGRKGRPMSRAKVADALDWLVRRGYLHQHARDPRGVRSLTLAWHVAPVQPEQAA